MSALRAPCVAIAFLAFAVPRPAFAGEEPVTLSNGYGASLTFANDPNGWRWERLQTPEGPDAGWPISEAELQLATTDHEVALGDAWTLAESTTDRVVLEQELAESGMQVRRVFAFGAASNTVRIETWLRRDNASTTLTRIDLLNAQIEGETFRETGVAPASFPAFGEALFAGIEHVSGECSADGPAVFLTQRPRLAIDEAWQRVATVVVGWTLPGAGTEPGEGQRVREAFLHYLDTVRVKPDRLVLHSETWWTLPPPLFEKEVLQDIETLRRSFHERTGMFFDTYALDLGWSNPRTFWQIDGRQFPSGFAAVNQRLKELGASLGLWLSPGSGYPEGLDNRWLEAQGYEMTPFPTDEWKVPCFALGGRYQREFKERIVSYAREYGLGHVILDFMAPYCDVASHGHPAGVESRYAIDAGVADVLDSLREINPQIALEPMVCGYPPSPWWLMKTPFILGPAGDDVPYGRVPSPEWLESLITARDIAYRTSQESWLMPTQALETWDIVMQTPGDFQNTAVMAVGRGRWFLSSYIKPELMQLEDWDFFAALVRWARHNQDLLTNAWMIGGLPEDREAYGYAFRDERKDVYCVRNPWIEERSLTLPAPLDQSGAREIRMIYPRRETLGVIEPGEPGLTIALGAYETVFIETVPAIAIAALREARQPPVAAFAATEVTVVDRPISRVMPDVAGVRLQWAAAITLPEVEALELCVLIEGAPDVSGAKCDVSISGRPVTPRHATSAGQFGAAIAASPDNWSWFTVPLAPGSATIRIEARAISGEGRIGVFLRGQERAESGEAPVGEPAFPVFNPQTRAWSQTLLPLQAYVAGGEPMPDAMRR